MLQNWTTLLEKAFFSKSSDQNSSYEERHFAQSLRTKKRSSRLEGNLYR